MSKTNKQIEQEEAENQADKKQAAQEQTDAEKLATGSATTGEVDSDRLPSPPNAPYASVKEQLANLPKGNNAVFNDRSDQRPTVAQQTDGMDSANATGPDGSKASDYEPLKGEPGNEQGVDDDEVAPGKTLGVTSRTQKDSKSNSTAAKKK